MEASKKIACLLVPVEAEGLGACHGLCGHVAKAVRDRDDKGGIGASVMINYKINIRRSQ